MKKGLLLLLTIVTFAAQAAYPASRSADKSLASESSTRDSEEFPASMASGTLPIIYINTEDAAPIVDKVTPITAGLYVSVPEGSEFEALGSESKPVELTIRGRGNSTWTDSPKKPYKLKFSKKTSLLNLPKSKHFALLHHNSGFADYLTIMSAMEMMRKLSGKWAPNAVPVEVILNGRYDGLYFLTETIKIDSNRLDIFEQEDGETDPETVPFGWLVEIDNYEDEYQIVIPEKDDTKIRVTYKSPEELSAEQLTWLTDEFNRIVNTVYGRPGGEKNWTDLIDARSVAEYFIIRELYHDWDAYNGSFYMHRDKGENAKWNFGPLWDVSFGNREKSDWLIRDHGPYSEVHLMGAIMETPEFRDAVREVWNEVYPQLIEDVKEYVGEVARTTDAADFANYARWPEISHNIGSISRVRWVNVGLDNNAKWIDEHLNDLSAVDEIISDDIESAATGPEYFTLQGLRVENPENGIFIRKKGSKVEKVLFK